jgi:hypothetical protein
MKNEGLPHGSKEFWLTGVYLTMEIQRSKGLEVLINDTN